LIPAQIAPAKEIKLSPGKHSELIREIIQSFAARFAPGAVLVYAGDTGEKWRYFERPLLAQLGVEVDSHGKMPRCGAALSQTEMASAHRIGH
jgi:hypothetical protein